jgi:hypothetical protein
MREEVACDRRDSVSRLYCTDRNDGPGSRIDAGSIQVGQNRTLPHLASSDSLLFVHQLRPGEADGGCGSVQTNHPVSVRQHY